MRHLLREKKERQDAEAARSANLVGCQDAIAGRTVAFKGDLRGLMQKAKKVSKQKSVKKSVHLTDSQPLQRTLHANSFADLGAICMRRTIYSFGLNPLLLKSEVSAAFSSTIELSNLHPVLSRSP